MSALRPALAPGVALALVLAAGACSQRVMHRTAGLGGPILQREGGSPKVVRERAAEVRRVPLDFAGVRALRIENFDGNVLVTAVAHGLPELHAHLRTVAGERKSASETLDSIRIATEREDDVLVVRLERPDLSKAYATSSSYELSVPGKIRVRAVNSSGDVEVHGDFHSVSLETTFGQAVVRGARGDVSAKSESGDITVEDAEGKRISAESLYGDVLVRDARAQEVQAQDRSGDIRLERVRTGRAHATTVHGQVDALDLEGSASFSTPDSQLSYEAPDGGAPVTLRVGRGEIACQGGEGALTITTVSGRVDVEGFAGSVAVDSRHGNVDLGGVFDAVHAQSGSGKLNVRAQPGSRAAATWRLRADYGNVVLALPASFACRLEAATDRGTIRSEFPVELDAEGEDAGLSGLLNGGGASVVLRSNSGRILIQHLDADEP